VFTAAEHGHGNCKSRDGSGEDGDGGGSGARRGDKRERAQQQKGLRGGSEGEVKGAARGRSSSETQDSFRAGRDGDGGDRIWLVAQP
jgi:hypothetical protein